VDHREGKGYAGRGERGGIAWKGGGEGVYTGRGDQLAGGSPYRLGRKTSGLCKEKFERKPPAATEKRGTESGSGQEEKGVFQGKKKGQATINKGEKRSKPPIKGKKTMGRGKKGGGGKVHKGFFLVGKKRRGCRTRKDPQRIILVERGGKL